MNVELLRKVQRHILAEPKCLDMGYWLARQPKEHGGPPCGTIGCIAGWTVVLAGGYTEAWKLHDYAAIPSRARDLLRLDDLRAARLFLPDHWPPDMAARREKARTAGVAAKVVAERIELFIRKRRQAMNAKPSTFRLVRALARTMRKDRWHLEWNGPLRLAGKEQQPAKQQCPLTRVAFHATGHRFSILDFHGAGRALGFSDREASYICKAADEPLPRRLRRILLRAAGLPVPAFPPRKP